jgi:hypothetical protein
MALSSSSCLPTAALDKNNCKFGRQSEIKCVYFVGVSPPPQQAAAAAAAASFDRCAQEIEPTEPTKIWDMGDTSVHFTTKDSSLQ